MTLYIDTKPTLDNWSEPSPERPASSYYCHIYLDTTFGRYMVEWKEWRKDSSYFVYFNAIFIAEVHGGLEAAKAAAQADYERRTAERFRPISDLLERAAMLVGNPGTNISGSTDLACIKWQQDYDNLQSAIAKERGEG